jgi:hypothetical protein
VPSLKQIKPEAEIRIKTIPIAVAHLVDRARGGGPVRLVLHDEAPIEPMAATTIQSSGNEVKEPDSGDSTTNQTEKKHDHLEKEGKNLRWSTQVRRVGSIRE